MTTTVITLLIIGIVMTSMGLAASYEVYESNVSGWLLRIGVILIILSGIVHFN